jgi:ferrochelatase
MTGETRHVVLVTYGEPPTASFVDQLVYSWRILVGLTRTVAPIPRPLLPIIALSRARGRNALWRTHGYGSPLEPITERQASQVRAGLVNGVGAGAWRVHVAYEFRRPLVADVLASIPPAEPVTIVPMYAAESAFTHALSRAVAEDHARATSRPAPVHVAAAVDVATLAELSSDHVLAHTPEEWRGSETALVLAAHGTVLNPPRPIDTGLAATDALRTAIAARLAPHFGTVANGWLNHTRGGKWTDPPIEEALQAVAEAGYTRVVYYPYGFLADNAESELEGRVALAALEGVDSKHLPCLNESPALARAIATLVVESAGKSAAPAA